MEKLTKEQAIELVGGEREYIHNFVNNGPGMLMGCDWTWAEFLKALDEAEEILEAGDQAKAMKHPLYLLHGKRRLFFERIEASRAES